MKYDEKLSNDIESMIDDLTIDESDSWYGPQIDDKANLLWAIMDYIERNYVKKNPAANEKRTKVE